MPGSLDTVNLFVAGRWIAALMNMVLNNAFSLVLVYIGAWAVRWLLIISGRM